MVNKKRAAMEMSVGTIVTIVLLMSALVLGLILTRSIFSSTTESVDSIDGQVKGEIQNLFGSKGNKLVVLLGKNAADVKQGTENFGIAFGFAPNDPRAWGDANNQNCRYSIVANVDGDYCNSEGMGWTNPENSIVTGKVNASFSTLENGVGYTTLKINIPKDIPPCLQRFTIIVKCPGYNSETSTSYFDINVLKKGIF